MSPEKIGNPYDVDRHLPGNAGRSHLFVLKVTMRFPPPPGLFTERVTIVGTLSNGSLSTPPLDCLIDISEADRANPGRLRGLTAVPTRVHQRCGCSIRGCDWRAAVFLDVGCAPFLSRARAS
jgi:hypothetical protein